METGAAEAGFEKGADIPSQFRRAVEERADQVAFIFKERRVKWGELGSRVYRVANRLLAGGLGKGSRAAILSRNSIEYVEAYFGTLVAGACAVPLPTMAGAEAFKAMLKDAAPAVLFVSSELAGTIEPFVDEIASLRDGVKVGLDFEHASWQAYEAWIGDAPAEPPRGVEIEPGDEFHIIYSSGTTGVPKGIRHSHGNRCAFVENFNPIFAMPGMVNIISTPFYSHTTMVTWLPSMCCATTTVLMDKFDVREFLRLCEAEKVTLAMLVPVQYERILRAKDLETTDLSSMLMKYSTSAPLHPDTKRRILEKIPGQLVEFYGLTEGGVGTVLIASQFPDKLDSVGIPVPGCEIKVIDDDGRELPRGQTGEIVGRNQVMMSGYHNRDRETRDILWFDADERAFVRSGDLGRMDEDGFLYVSGRKRDMIISGGFNVFAVDLENELLKHEAVREAAVIGVPSDRWGETPLAFVVVDPEAEETAESLLEWVNRRLGKNQRISRVELRDELPKNQIGKVLKNELRAPYWKK
ncbi:MAG: class I adenylate-forming enzyme family protein [bacterium]